MIEAEEAPPIDDEAGLESLAPGDPNGIVSGNGALPLTPELLALTLPLAPALALISLDTELLSVNELLATIEGRTFLHYVVKCALPKGQSLTINTLGATYTFPGHVGLVPEWTTAPLTPQGRRWMSACIYAHINLTGASVSIHLLGNHPALSQPSTVDTSTYTVQEGAFYGDLFTLVPSKYACTGSGYNPSRQCAQGGLLGLSPCGFTVPGDCRGADNTCEGVVNGIFKNCHGALILPLFPTQAYAETITVYTQP